MTPTEIELIARQRYNAVGDTFFSQAEIFSNIYDAELQLAEDCDAIKAVYQTTSVADQDEYATPTNMIKIRKIEYDSKRLEPISERERDVILGGRPASGVTGTPHAYWLWGDSIFLVKTPSTSSLTIKIFTYDIPSTVTEATTLEVPARYHMDMVDYVLARMFAKDKNYQLTEYHMNLWRESLKQAKITEMKRKLSDTTIQTQVDLDYTFGKDAW